MATLDKPAEAPLCPGCGGVATWCPKGMHTDHRPGWWCTRRGCGKSEQIGAAAPEAKGDRREELKRRILETVAAHATQNNVFFDVVLAEFVGVADRDALRGLLAELVIDGRLAVEPYNVDPDSAHAWVDGEAPWRVRLAPAGTPSLEERIVAALAEAGIDGLEERPLDEKLACAIGLPDELFVHLTTVSLKACEALAARGIIREHERSFWSLTPAEWARRLCGETSAALRCSLTPELFDALATRFGHLLAGADSEPAVTPAAATRRTGEG